VLIVRPYQNLVVIDVILLICACVPIVISAASRRTTEPDDKPAIRVPLGSARPAAIVALLLALATFAAHGGDIDRPTMLLGCDGFHLPGADVV
jgi:hypothetical protein